MTRTEIVFEIMTVCSAIVLSYFVIPLFYIQAQTVEEIIPTEKVGTSTEMFALEKQQELKQPEKDFENYIRYRFDKLEKKLDRLYAK